jgi:hypothetical protein
MRSKLGWIIAYALLASACGAEIPSPGPMPPGVTFAGNWDSNWGTMKLAQNGKRVFGPFKGFRNGSVSGEQNGDLLTFFWVQKEGNQSGRGYLRISRDGNQLEGRWGYLRSYDNGGKWSAKRAAAEAEQPFE